VASRAEAWKATGPIGASAIESLYELHAPRLRRQCMRLTADAAAADDLMQEVFVRFMTRFPDPPAEMNVGAYLHRTARNVLWNQRRDAHEVLVDDLETTLGPDDQLERDPERAALLVEQRHLVRRCATLLTRRQRRALTLRDVDGQSYAEIGSELGIGADAVAQVISRARMRLRSVVRREQVDLDELRPECRAMLGPLSDYVDGRASSSAPALEAHLAGCERCRHTLAAYQEAGLRLRGGAPLVPLAGLLARLGEVIRGGGEGPIGIAAVASVVTAAALAVGGGGMLVAQRLTESPVHRAPAITAPRHATTTVPARHSIAAVTGSSAPRAPVAGVHHRRAGAAHRTGHATRAGNGPRSTPSTAPSVAPALAATPAAAPVNNSPSATSPPARTTAPAGTSPVTPTTTPGVVPPAVAPTHINSVTTPPASVPSVSVPSVTTPAVAVPQVTVPPISTLEITTPIATVPGSATPAISTPSVTVPPVTTPPISTPVVEVPPITTPKLP
jgi:RNA polymerase sigma factor (sigma-70 family)